MQTEIVYYPETVADVLEICRTSVCSDRVSVTRLSDDVIRELLSSSRRSYRLERILDKFLCGKIKDERTVYHSEEWKKANKKLHAFDYIPLNPIEFLDCLAKSRPHLPEEVKFIDAGCGTGNKVKLAEWYFGHEHKIGGIELDEAFIPPYHPSIVQGNILTHDYSPYNLIYAYNPINDMKGMAKFFKQVIKTAIKGTVCALVNVSTGAAAMDESYIRPHFAPLGKHVYRLQ